MLLQQETIKLFLNQILKIIKQLKKNEFEIEISFDPRYLKTHIRKQTLFQYPVGVQPIKYLIIIKLNQGMEQKTVKLQNYSY